MGRTGSFRFPQSLRSAHGGRPNGLEIRALAQGDEPELNRFFAGVSDESIHRRFMYMRRGMREEQIRLLLQNRPAGDLVLVATLNSNGAGEIAGIGQYFSAPHGNSAEFAVLVRDDLQGIGIGTALLGALRLEARSRGIEALTASVLSENAAMLHVAGKAGFKADGGIKDGLLSLRASLNPDHKGMTPAGRK